MSWIRLQTYKFIYWLCTALLCILQIFFCFEFWNLQKNGLYTYDIAKKLQIFQQAVGLNITICVSQKYSRNQCLIHQSIHSSWVYQIINRFFLYAKHHFNYKLTNILPRCNKKSLKKQLMYQISWNTTYWIKCSYQENCWTLISILTLVI